MKLGLHLPDFTWPNGAPGLRTDLAAVARATDDAGFASLSVMDHFFQRMWSADDGPFQGTHVEAERLLNVPQALSEPSPPILIEKFATDVIPAAGKL
ncbi:hypothetical protein [Amycolatopsis sp. lyj-112]|uniref:hypothetical protein n=1 Tax=Amycolatopsis sp. lyj-112 TaxID=2789288 RepID=UPI00397D4EDB